MTKEKFKIELKKRLSKRLKSQSFDEMTVGGSKMRFEMELAINEYPFEIPEGESEKDYESLLTEEQYMSGDFDKIIDEVFSEALKSS